MNFKIILHPLLSTVPHPTPTPKTFFLFLCRFGYFVTLKKITYPPPTPATTPPPNLQNICFRFGFFVQKSSPPPIFFRFGFFVNLSKRIYLPPPPPTPPHTYTPLPFCQILFLCKKTCTTPQPSLSTPPPFVQIWILCQFVRKKFINSPQTHTYTPLSYPPSDPPTTIFFQIWVLCQKHALPPPSPPPQHPHPF